jgi:XapX domain-containing protein
VKAYAISLAVGLLVGAFYSTINVRSPAPPLIALAGLLGMVIGEQVTPIALDAVRHLLTRR